MTSTSAYPARLKKTASIVCYVLFLVFLVEATGHVAYRITQTKWFSAGELKLHRKDILKSLQRRDIRRAAELDKYQKGQGGWRSEIVHPYIGYVVDFHERGCGSIGFCDDRIRSYIAEYPERSFVENTEHNLVVALIGGSFAYGVGNNSTAGKWEEVLRSIPGYEDKKLYLYTFALGGIKQPQQLNAMSFFLGMGADFDLIINIDGFNEIALPASENVGRNVNPYFPRVWHRRVGRSKVDSKLERLRGEHAFVHHAQAEVAENFDTRWFRNSALANLIWIIRDNGYKEKLAQIELETIGYKKEDKVLISTLEARGPRFKFTDYDDIIRQSVDFWARSSVSMQGMSQAHNIPYFHFLQPNQYLRGSKEMTEEEVEIAINKKHPYHHAATVGYPMLVNAGRELKGRGINFTDLTQMFSNNAEILYVDACCHLSQRGYDYVIDEIGGVLKDFFASQN